MNAIVSSFRRRLALALSFSALLCAMGCCMLTANAGTAHALFTSDTCVSTSHVVTAFPSKISVSTDSGDVTTKEIDRSRLTVTLTLSDGTSRVLDGDEYELFPAELPAGEKGMFDVTATYAADGYEASVPFCLHADEAYGAQYGDTLVFGRGIPADTYEGKALSNATWGIEKSGCAPMWTKANLTKVVDIDIVSPVSLANWFNNAAALRSVVLDQMDTSQVVNLSHVFVNNTNMEVADVSKWNTSRVTSIEGMFGSCTSLKALNLSAWDTSSLVWLTLAFYNANKMTTVGDLRGWNMSKVRSLANTFDLCNSLESIGDVSRWDTSNVEGMGYLFASCFALKNVDCRSWNVSRVTNHSDFNRSASGVLPPTWR